MIYTQLVEKICYGFYVEVFLNSVFRARFSILINYTRFIGSVRGSFDQTGYSLADAFWVKLGCFKNANSIAFVAFLSNMSLRK